MSESKLTTIATITIILLVVVIMCSRFTEFGAWFVPRLSQQAHAGYFPLCRLVAASSSRLVYLCLVFAVLLCLEDGLTLLLGVLLHLTFLR